MKSLQTRCAPARLAVILAAMLAVTALPAPDAAAGSRSQKAAKNQGGKVKIKNIRSSSEETPAQRDKRLYRECQGRPNAGACAGYTQR